MIRPQCVDGYEEAGAEKNPVNDSAVINTLPTTTKNTVKRSAYLILFIFSQAIKMTFIAGSEKLFRFK